MGEQMILFNDVASQWNEIEETALPKLINFLREGPYIQGKHCDEFESAFAQYCGVRNAIGVSNGTDGLKMALQCLPRANTVVLVPSNGHISDALAPAYNNLPMFLIDCDEYYNMDSVALNNFLNISSVSTTIIVVHMYGQAANVPEIRRVAPHSFIIEDCSQAFGATIEGRSVGTFGDIGVFSLYPTKNLGALGDAGVVITNNDSYAETLKSIRNYGKDSYTSIGHNHRLDEMQALILKEKLPLVKKWIERKRYLANLYREQLSNIEGIILPLEAPYNDGSTYHIFPIRVPGLRDVLQQYLKDRDIPTLIHYPILIQEMPLFRTVGNKRAFQYSRELLSLPMHPYLKENDIYTITTAIKEFLNVSASNNNS